MVWKDREDVSQGTYLQVIDRGADRGADRGEGEATNWATTSMVASTAASEEEEEETNATLETFADAAVGSREARNMTSVEKRTQESQLCAREQRKDRGWLASAAGRAEESAREEEMVMVGKVASLV